MDVRANFLTGIDKFYHQLTDHRRRPSWTGQWGLPSSSYYYYSFFIRAQGTAPNTLTGKNRQTLLPFMISHGVMVFINALRLTV